MLSVVFYIVLIKAVVIFIVQRKADKTSRK
jgi:hypothetical protein